MSRVSLGFLLSAFALPALAFVTGAVGLAIYVAVFTAGATGCFGLPLYAWARARRWYPAGLFVLGGIVAGVLCAVPFGIFAMSAEVFVGFGTLFGLFGAAHGTLFWLVAIFRNEALPASSLPTVK
jgi:hypothetical protein